MSHLEEDVRAVPGVALTQPVSISNEEVEWDNNCRLKTMGRDGAAAPMGLSLSVKEGLST